MNKVWRIVTDAVKWYFTLDEERKGPFGTKTSFKLSEPVVVVYNDENMENMVGKVLGHIIWLLEEVQKSDSVTRIGN